MIFKKCGQKYIICSKKTPGYAKTERFYVRDPCRIQTCNLLIRSQMLYSVELRGLVSKRVRKNTLFFISKSKKFF